MSTVTEGVAETSWSRLRGALKTWGSKVAKVTKRAGNWFKAMLKKSGAYIKRAGKWVLEAKATQWVLEKTKPAWDKAWPIIKGPILWLATPILAIALMPKVVVALLVVLGVLVVVLAFSLWRVSKSRKKDSKVYTDEEWDAITDVVAYAKGTWIGTFNDKTTTEVFESKRVKVKGKTKVLWREHPKVVVTDSPVAKAATNGAFKDGEKSQGNQAPLTLSGEIDPRETTSSRREFLAEQLDDAAARAQIDLLSEAHARGYLHDIRAGVDLDEESGTQKLKRGAMPGTIYAECRRRMETPEFAGLSWNFNLMDRAIADEHLRYKELVKQAEQLADAS